MLPLLISAAACYGALAGLLLPLPRYRLAVAPELPWRAACERGHLLPGRLAGWLGASRCAHCPGGPLPEARGWWYAAVTAGACAALAAAVGARPELAVWLLAAPVVVLLAGVDVAVQRLPDVLTLPLAAGLAAGLGLAALLPGAAGDWTRAVAGGEVLGAVYFVLFLIYPEGLGLGDVKLALGVGVALGWYGWDAVFLGTFAGFLLAAGYGAALVVAGRAGRKTAVPFGPFMALGALAGVGLGGLAA